MKYNKSILKVMFFFTLIFMLQSCESTIPLTSNLQDFEVNVLNSTVKVGQEVVFSFKGDPDIIYFYSDEMFHQYSHKDGRVVRVIKTELSFDTQTPTLSNRQIDQMSVLVSTDYVDTGQEYADILKANWIDISSRCVFSTDNNYINSGLIDLTDIIVDGEPFHIGFKYINDSDNGRPGRCNIQNFSLTAILETGPITLGAMSTSGLKIVEQYPEYPSSSTISRIRINFYGKTYPEINPIETWVVSMPFISGSIDYGPDRPITVKGISSDLEDFTYIFEEPGEYNLMFFAKNINIDNEVETMREVKIIVTE